MTQGKEVRSRFFSLSPRFRYLPETDRYLFATDRPVHHFNIIGSGANGQEHIRVTNLEGRATIHGVYDPNPGSVRAAQEIQRQFSPGQELVVYDTLEAACNDPAVDGLIISTPNYTHIDVVRVAARSGKHILLEKPMATTIPDAYEILQFAEKHPAVFQIGLQYRYMAIYREAIHEALERRALGDLKTITILEHRYPFLDKVEQWNKFSKFSGGTLVEKCCHYFDLFNLFAEARPLSIYGSGGQAVNFREFEREQKRSDILDYAFVTVRYANDVQANFNLCMFSPMFYEEIVLCGDRGRLKAWENQDFIDNARPKAGLEVHLGEHQPSRFTTPLYPQYIQESGHYGATFYEHINFVDQMEGKPSNAATAREGFWSIVVGAAAEESVRTGQVVQVDELLQRHGIPL